MTARSLALLVSLSALCTTVARAEAAPVLPTAFTATAITVARWDSLTSRSTRETIRVGTSERTVVRLLGTPLRVAGTTVCYYYNCESDQAVADGCRILAVTYKNDVVTSLRFVNQPAADVIARNETNHSAQHTIAAE